MGAIQSKASAVPLFQVAAQASDRLCSRLTGLTPQFPLKLIQKLSPEPGPSCSDTRQLHRNQGMT